MSSLCVMWLVSTRLPWKGFSFMAERCLCGYGILPVSKCYGVVNDAHCSPAVKNITKKNKRGVKEMDDIIKRGKENKCRGRERLTQGSGGGRTRERWMDRKKRSRAITRARYAGREGMFSSRWPNDSWQVSSAHRPLGSQRKIMGRWRGGGGGGQSETEWNKRKENGECDRKIRMGRLTERGRNWEVVGDTNTGHLLQIQGQSGETEPEDTRNSLYVDSDGNRMMVTC